jgi:hypothetical protein
MHDIEQILAAPAVNGRKLYLTLEIGQRNGSGFIFPVFQAPN